MKFLEVDSLDPQGTSITFNVGDEQIIKLSANGDIFIKGKLADNDIEVVDGLRQFLTDSHLIK